MIKGCGDIVTRMAHMVEVVTRIIVEGKTALCSLDRVNLQSFLSRNFDWHHLCLLTRQA